MAESIISKYDFNNKHSNLGLEIIPLTRILNFSNEKGYDSHRLNFYQIIIVTGGRGIHEVDFERIAYSENTVIPVAMGQVQRYYSNPQLKGYALLFTADFLVKDEFDYHYLYDYTIFKSYDKSAKPYCKQRSIYTFTRNDYRATKRHGF